MIPIRNTVPSRYPATVTWTLIAINCVIFLFQITLSPIELLEFLFRFALIPARYFAALGGGRGEIALGDFLPFITMMFLHGGWLHLILNMWMLWLFGPTIEDRFGHGRYLVFYLTCGVLAGLAHAIFNPTSTEPALGASGAIAGVLGCYMRLFPFARVIVLVPILFIPLFFEVPGLVFVGFWFVTQVLSGTIDLLIPSRGGGVAWWAHIGGFIAGFAFASLLTQPERRYRAYYPDEGILGFTPTGRR